MFKKHKKKYYAWILKKEHNGYNRIGKKRVKATTEIFNYKKIPFKINTQLYTYSRGLKNFYMFDLDTKSQMLIGKVKVQNVDSDVYDMVFLKRIVKHLSSNLDKNEWKINLMTLIIGAISGGAIGFIIAGYI